MSSNNDYPDGQGNQIDWNTNLPDHAGLLPGLGCAAAQVTGITDDGQMLAIKNEALIGQPSPILTVMVG